MVKVYVILLYIRISVEDLDNHENGKDESNSISNQREMLRKFVESNPEFADCQVIELCDDGYSGTNLNRPAVTKLIEMVKKGQADCVIVKDFSRFGRDYLTVSDYVDQIFPFMGVRFISINDNYDSAKCNGATSGVDMAFRNVIYGYYSQDLSIKVRSGKRTKAENGDFLSPFAPIGYRKSREDKNQLLIEPQGAELVRRIFQMAGAGWTTMQIVRQLNAEQTPTSSAIKNSMGLHHKWWEGIGTNKLWDSNTITNILRDERYLGKNIFGKRVRHVVGSYQTRKQSRNEWIVVDDCHEPIVSTEEFAAANNNLKKYVEKEFSRNTIHLFSGKLRCGSCGYALTRSSRPTPRFSCVTHRRVVDCHCIKGHLEEKELSDVVLSAIHVYISALLDEKALSHKAEQDGRMPMLKKQFAAIQKNLAGMKEQKAQLYDLFADEEISREGFKKKQELLSLRQKNSEQQLASIQEELSKLEKMLYSAHTQEEELQAYQHMTELTREMVVTLVDCIYVFPDRSIHIQWRFEKESV